MRLSSTAVKTLFRDFRICGSGAFRRIFVGCRFQTKKAAIEFICDHIQQYVRPLANVSCALTDAPKKLAVHVDGVIAVDAPDVL